MSPTLRYDESETNCAFWRVNLPIPSLNADHESGTADYDVGVTVAVHIGQRDIIRADIAESETVTGAAILALPVLRKMLSCLSKPLPTIISGRRFPLRSPTAKLLEFAPAANERGDDAEEIPTPG